MGTIWAHIQYWAVSRKLERAKRDLARMEQQELAHQHAAAALALELAPLLHNRPTC